MAITLRKRRTPSQRAVRRGQQVLAPSAARVRHSASHYGSGAKEKAVLVAVPAAAAAKTWAAPKAGAAADWAGPRAGAARNWVGPRVEHAVDAVRDDVLPKVAAVVAGTAAAVQPVREEAMTRGSAAVAALRGEVAPPKPRHRGRKALLGAGLLGSLAAAWWAWSQREDSTSWEYDRSDSAGAAGGGTTSPTTASTTTASTPAAAMGAAGAGGTQGDPLGGAVPTTPVSDDAAGASPDEALADAAPEDDGVSTDPAAGVIDVREIGEPDRPPLEATDSPAVGEEPGDQQK